MTEQKKTMADQRYTLSLPPEIYEELQEQAQRRGMSTKEIVRQCLKFALVVMKLDERDNVEFYIKEKIATAGSDDVAEIKETRLQMLW